MLRFECCANNLTDFESAVKAFLDSSNTRTAWSPLGGWHGENGGVARWSWLKPDEGDGFNYNWYGVWK